MKKNSLRLLVAVILWLYLLPLMVDFYQLFNTSMAGQDNWTVFYHAIPFSANITSLIRYFSVQSLQGIMAFLQWVLDAQITLRFLLSQDMARLCLAAYLVIIINNGFGLNKGVDKPQLVDHLYDIVVQMIVCVGCTIVVSSAYSFFQVQLMVLGPELQKILSAIIAICSYGGGILVFLFVSLSVGRLLLTVVINCLKLLAVYGVTFSMIFLEHQGGSLLAVVLETFIWGFLLWCVIRMERQLNKIKK